MPAVVYAVTSNGDGCDGLITTRFEPYFDPLVNCLEGY